MHFVDDIDLIPRRRRAVMHGINDFTHVIHAGARCCIHFHHVHMTAFGNGAAGIAFAARFGRGAACTIRPDTVQPLGNDPRRGGFARSTNARHHERMRNPVRREGVFQRAHHRLLADQIGKGFGAVFAGKHLIGGRGGVGHFGLWDSGYAAD